MGRYLVRRLAECVPLIFITIILNFFLIHVAPGDPARLLAGESAYADPTFIDTIRQRYGLDKPLPEQFIVYLFNVFRGDWGYSYSRGIPVLEIIVSRVLPTLLLFLAGIFLSVVIGTLAGAYAARRNGSKIDSILSTFFLAIYSIPAFWLGLVLISVFSVNLGWFPTSGMTSVPPPEGIMYPLDLLYHMFLPLIVVIAFYSPTFMRLARASTIETMKEDYVKTFVAAGLDENRIFYRHVLRNSILPTVTMLSLWLGLIFVGGVLTESVFAWPGMGRLVLDAVDARDYPVLMGIFTISSVFVVIASMLADILYAILDPRIVHR